MSLFYFYLYMYVLLLMVCVYILIISYADFTSGKSTPKSVKSKMKNTTTIISQPTPQQILKKVEFEITSKPTLRRSPRLTPKVFNVQLSCDEKVPKKEPLVIKLVVKNLK